MTAAKLLDALIAAGCDPAPGPVGLLLTDPPAEWEKYLPILGTGVRALLLGKRWCGIDCATGRFLGPRGNLNPAMKLPRNVGLLIVEAAGEQWDRLSPWALDDFPDCFDPKP